MSEAESSGNGHEPRIYFLPNLFTAGNLFCGFLALTKIVEADLAQGYGPIQEALLLILLACIFDALDGRVARMGGYESPFGREFDSIADIVSFGVAPAFLVHRVVLKDVFGAHAEIGWFIASVYVICGALRLARYNCISASEEASGVHSKEFVGFPIPAAAGLVASVTLFLIWLEGKEIVDKGNWKYALPVLLVFLSAMMVSRVPYPTFKRIDWRAPRSFMKMVFAAMAVGFLFTVGRHYLPVVMPAIFITYLVYGFVRPFMSRRMRRGIEEDLAEARH
ncbi:MAG: CDP-diacylglycerol--serine O-phosphatidyltransferase [Verrucomicrobiales bacterium]|nr:CDP-diacylglycerol--serine O-phosphatidyltransferase [Verrucomicrobiales bacterium]|tara:strand:- start:1124 stop:1960 length:837 start_codon:yes stop_codon:yes gene_type:complete